MSKDIRSYFSVQTTSKSKINDSCDRKTKTTPSSKKTGSTSLNKKRKIIIDSDSDEEEKKSFTPKKNKKDDKTVLKPANIEDVFEATPVKQAPVRKLKKIDVPKEKPVSTRNAKKKKQKELEVHDDKDFQQSLLDLDDDLLNEHVDFLDKTIEESTSADSKPVKEQNDNKESTPSKDKRKRPAASSCDQVPKPEDTAETDQDRYEKKRYSAMLYQKYLNRSGPIHHGVKEYPKGKPDCLKHLCFIRTGILDSLQNDEFEDLIKEHGGRVVHSISKKVNYVVIGDEPGPAKLEKAKTLNIPLIKEDELLDLILVKSGENPKYASNGVCEEKVTLTTEENDTDKIPKVTKVLNTEVYDIQLKAMQEPIKQNSENKRKEVKDETVENSNRDQLCWVEKYKPVNTKAIIGQQGDKSNMRKLTVWLQNWYKNHSGSDRPKLTKPSPWAKSDDGAYFKAALLSGPPGVGKTTTATLVAKELGFDVVEFNASDTRSKKLLHVEITQLLSTKSLAGFFNDGSAPSNRHLLLMDEVDGMAGNEDRGGMQELIALIKNTNIPVICLCNDRNHTKVRSLANYCFDLRFSKPRLEQIKGSMMSICFKEGIRISAEALSEIIAGSGMDIRQTLTHLSLWTADEKNLSLETAQKEAKAAGKDSPLGPWEVCRKVFTEQEHKEMSLADKARLFYYDYSLGPLFVQENYLRVIPHKPAAKHLECAANAADALSLGDVVDKKIRSTNNWSLLEVESMYCSVLPGFYMEGHVGGPIDFPSWLGKNSKKNKLKRIQGELHSHMRTSTSGSRTAINLDYAHFIRGAITKSLSKGTDGIPDALEVMHSYNLLREDLDNILELTGWPNQKDPMNMVDSKVKAAFTRAYNKNPPKLPYAGSNQSVKKTKIEHNDEELLDENEMEEVQESNDDNIDNDAMIKIKKTQSKKAAKAEPKKGGKGKGRKTSK